MKKLSKLMAAAMLTLVMTLMLGLTVHATVDYGDDEGYGDDIPEVTSAEDDDPEQTTAAATTKKKVYYDLTVSSTDGGSVPGYERTSTYEKNTRVNMEAVAEEGYVFVGWRGDASGDSEVKRVIMDADKVVTAIFEEVGEEEVTMAETVAAETTTAAILDETKVASESMYGIGDGQLPRTAGIPVAIVISLGGVFGLAGLSLKKK